MDPSLRPTEQTPRVATDSNFFVAEPCRPAPDAAPAAPRTVPAWRLWVSRVLVVLFVALCIEVGILLMVLPWYGRIWTDNSFMLAHPWLRSVAAGSFVRGLVTGLGLVDIWLGIWEAARYRDPQPAPPPAAPTPPATS